MESHLLRGTPGWVAPVLLDSSDPAGTYSWSVTFSGAGQSMTRYFAVKISTAGWGEYCELSIKRSKHFNVNNLISLPDVLPQWDKMKPER